jgi:hypothetical protein
MRQFRGFLNDVVLMVIHLNGMLYTWSNEHAHQTLECIDWAFISNGWECIFPRCDLHALPSHCSEYAPLSTAGRGSHRKVEVHVPTLLDKVHRVP